MPPRRLSPPERAVWGYVAETVTPLERKDRLRNAPVAEPVTLASTANHLKLGMLTGPVEPGTGSTAPSQKLTTARSDTLDAGWDKRLAKGMVAPDRTIDLHGDTLQIAHSRLNHALSDAILSGERLILLVTGKSPRENARMPPTSRGVIRQSIHDWLASSSHASKIAAVRNAHPRHGGAGAIYLILKRRR